MYMKTIPLITVKILNKFYMLIEMYLIVLDLIINIYTNINVSSRGDIHCIEINMRKQ